MSMMPGSAVLTVRRSRRRAEAEAQTCRLPLALVRQPASPKPEISRLTRCWLTVVLAQLPEHHPRRRGRRCRASARWPVLLQQQQSRERSRTGIAGQHAVGEVLSINDSWSCIGAGGCAVCGGVRRCEAWSHYRMPPRSFLEFSHYAAPRLQEAGSHDPAPQQ